MNNEQRIRQNVVNTALRIASDLELLDQWLDKAFYTDDDNDLNAHYVHDGDWFNQNQYPFRFTDTEELRKTIERWARKLQSTINEDLVTDPTINA
jgi:hypothetical protein